MPSLVRKELAQMIYDLIRFVKKSFAKFRFFAKTRMSTESFSCSLMSALLNESLIMNRGKCYNSKHKL